MKSQTPVHVRVAAAFAAVVLSAILVWAHGADEQLLGAQEIVVSLATSHVAAR